MATSGDVQVGCVLVEIRLDVRLDPLYLGALLASHPTDGGRLAKADRGGKRPGRPSEGCDWWLVLLGGKANWREGR